MPEQMTDEEIIAFIKRGPMITFFINPDKPSKGAAAAFGRDDDESEVLIKRLRELGYQGGYVFSEVEHDEHTLATHGKLYVIPRTLVVIQRR